MNNTILQRSIDFLHHFMVNSSLLNTSNLNKCIVVLFLGGLDFIIFLLWIYYSSTRLDYYQWLNTEFYLVYVVYALFGISTCWILGLICFYFKKNHFIQKFMPYICVWYLCINYMISGYCIGILSPAMIAAYVNMIFLGLVLFTRDIVYSTLIPMTIVLLVLIFLSIHQLIPYAPLFSDALNQSVLVENMFWVYSMLIIYLPIFICSVLIFEVLLLQWQNRENLINEISQKDPLTGVFNRRVIDHNLKNLHQTVQACSVILIDLDHFKAVNDGFGHDVGDHVLRRIAKVLSANVRGSDIVGRFGGEEFIMILQSKGIDQVREIAERCRKQIEAECFMIREGMNICITASFGFSVYRTGMTYEQLIKQADQALYLAKANGRNQVQCADSNLKYPKTSASAQGEALKNKTDELKYKSEALKNTSEE